MRYGKLIFDYYSIFICDLLQKFPDTNIEDVVFNVFDFDRYNPELVETLGEVLAKHGFSSKNVLTAEYIAAKRAKENIQVTVNRKSG